MGSAGGDPLPGRLPVPEGDRAWGLRAQTGPREVLLSGGEDHQFAMLERK